MKTKASSEVYTLDVPEVEDMNATFVYNFFTRDEAINENFIDETKFKSLERNFEGYVTSIKDQVPRFVTINFKPIEFRDEIGDPKKDYQGKIRTNNYKRESREQDFIKKNLDKVISEDHFSTGKFSAVQFKAGAIKDLAYQATSGSISHFMFDKYYRFGASRLQQSRMFASSYDQTINPEFVLASLSESDNHNGINRFDVYQGRVSNIGSRITLFNEVEDVYSHGQVNNKVFNDITLSMVSDPFCPTTIDSKSLILDLKQKKINVISKLTSKILSSIKFVDATSSDVNIDMSKIKTELVGYVVDKIEILKNTVKVFDQIVIEGKNTGAIIDYNVKYGSTYMYAVRAVYKVKLPVYDETLDRMSIATILVSSRPSRSKYVYCIDTVSPPSPADFTFHWDNENDRVMLRWSFPLNTQRDIKKFQVFRRKTIHDPFELIKQYDFNDSLKQQRPIENPDSSLIEKLARPKTIFFDDEFGKNSRYIYAVVSIDAHELTSEYSDQFEIWFDRRRNRLMKRLISHSGAPKQYPNLFLERDLFVDTIRVNKKDTMSVYFTPDFYNYVDNEGNEHDAFASNDFGGSYKLSVINLDNQKSRIVNVNINDKRPKSPSVDRQPPPPFSSAVPSKYKAGSGGKGKF